MPPSGGQVPELPPELGRPEGTGTEVQAFEPFDGAGWTGVRIHREVSVGSVEVVERRLVRSGDVVLLVVLRSDVLGDEQLDVLDTLLEQVGERLD
jgi:hypothetical protein